jgi:hypothetical protein
VAATANQRSAIAGAPWLWLRRLALIGLLGFCVLLGAAILFRPEAQRDGARTFGRLANMIRNRPNRAAAVCVVSVAALWAGIATLMAGQEAGRLLKSSRPQ